MEEKVLLSTSLSHSITIILSLPMCKYPIFSLVRLSSKGNTGSHLFTEVKPCWTGLISGWVTIEIKYPVLYCLGSQAGVVDINHTFHLYYKCCMWTEFQSISTWLWGFSPGTPVSSLLKIDSQSNLIWIMFRGRAPSRQLSSFGPTSLRCALGNSVYGLRCGWLAGQNIYIYIIHLRSFHKLLL